MPSTDQASAMASLSGTQRHATRHASQPRLASAESAFVCSLVAPRKSQVQFAVADRLP